jgi:hypothetical protein
VSCSDRLFFFKAACNAHPYSTCKYRQARSFQQTKNDYLCKMGDRTLPFDLINDIVLKTECRDTALRVGFTCSLYHGYKHHWLQLPILINMSLEWPNVIAQLLRVAKKWVPSDVIIFYPESKPDIDHVSSAGELVALRWLIDDLGFTYGIGMENAQLVAAKYDRVDVFEYLHSKTIPSSYLRVEFALEAASSGSSKVINWMLTRRWMITGDNEYGLTSHMWNRVLKAACKSGHTHIMITLEQFIDSKSTELLNLAIKLGQLDMVEFMLDKKCVSVDINTTSYAAENGWLDIAKMLHARGVSFNSDAFDLAVKNKHDELVCFLTDIGVKYSTIISELHVKGLGNRLSKSTEQQGIEFHSIDAKQHSTYLTYSPYGMYANTGSSATGNLPYI